MNRVLERESDFSRLRGHFMNKCSYILFYLLSSCAFCLLLYSLTYVLCVLYHNHNFIQYTGIKAGLLT
jgi:hypothetical protein